MRPAVTLLLPLQPLTRSPHATIPARPTRMRREWGAFPVGIGTRKTVNSVTDAGLSCVSLTPRKLPRSSACRREWHPSIRTGSGRFTSSSREARVWPPGTTSMPSCWPINRVPLGKSSLARLRPNKSPGAKVRRRNPAEPKELMSLQQGQEPRFVATSGSELRDQSRRRVVMKIRLTPRPRQVHNAELPTPGCRE